MTLRSCASLTRTLLSVSEFHQIVADHDTDQHERCGDSHVVESGARSAIVGLAVSSLCFIAFFRHVASFRFIANYLQPSLQEYVLADYVSVFCGSLGALQMSPNFKMHVLD